MTKKSIFASAAALATVLFGTLGTSSITNAAITSETTGTGTATVTLTEGSLNFVQVPNFDYGSHAITASMTGLTQTAPVTSDLEVQDYRGLPGSDPSAGYTVQAAVQGGANGFLGVKGNTLTTANVSVALGNSTDNTLTGNSAADITTTNIIAHGLAGQAVGDKQTVGGTASMDITNGSLIADTYNATVNYTLVAGIQ